MDRRLAPALTLLAALAGCQLGVDIVVCRGGGDCPEGTACDAELGVCRADAPGDAGTPDDDDGDGRPDGGTTPAEGEGEGEGEVGAEGEGEGEGEPSAPSATVCGDAARQGREDCDDGNRLSGDGCSSTCRVDQSMQEVEPNDYPNDSGSQVMPTSTVFVAGITTMVYDEVYQQSFSEYDTFWLSPTSPVVVRIESFTSSDTDDCSGTSGSFVDLFREEIRTDPTQPRLRGAYGNGNGPCSVLTTTMTASPHMVLLGEATGTALIPSYRVQATVLDDRGTEQEPNDDLLEAEEDAIDGLDATMSGALADAEDVDVYRVDVPPGRGLRAEIIPDSESTPCDAFNARISLLDQGGVERASRAGDLWACPFIDGTGDAPKNPEALNLTFAARTFYVVVSKGASGMVGALPYRVALTVR